MLKDNLHAGKSKGLSNLQVLGILWLTISVLYLPAAKAGEVGDFYGLIYRLDNISFKDFINRPDSLSLYQFTQLVLYAIFKIIGTSPVLWHLLETSAHAINCLMLYIICKGVLEDSKVNNAGLISFAGVFLYALTPYNTEVVVHEPCYHYLQGYFIVLLILYWVQRYQHDQKPGYVWAAGILYFLSTYSLEVFYFTPWLCLALMVYYRVSLKYDAAVFRKSLLCFFLPMLVLYGAHVVVLRMVINRYVGHVAFPEQMLGIHYLSKMPEYLYHVLLLGRYWPQPIRQAAYELCESWVFLIPFYTTLCGICLYLTIRFNRLSVKGKAGVLVLVWLLLMIFIATAFEIPKMQLVLFDRYTYFMSPFLFIMLALLLVGNKRKRIAITILALYAVCNIYCLELTNYYWKRSAYIVKRLLNEIPPPGNKTIVLLNLPENMNGILMTGAQDVSLWKLAHNLVSDHKIDNEVYDAASFNMTTPEDGAHVNVINDSTIRVTLNQWGTWWWYKYRGGISYENDAYILDMKDAGHYYDLTLKRDPASYLLLFAKGDKWQQADLSRKNIDQY